MVVCTDGNYLEVHPSYSFTTQQWNALPDAEKRKLQQERAEYKRQRKGINYDELRSIVSKISTATGFKQQQEYPNSVQDRSVQEQSTAITNDSRSTAMGGRNEQANLRTRNASG